MKNYKEAVKKKLILGGVLLFLLFSLNLIMFVIKDWFVGDTDLAFYYQLGISIGISLCICVFLFVNGKAYRNEEKLKKLYIEEHDERRKMIAMKTGSTAIMAVIFIIALASIVAFYIDITVAITLIAMIYLIGIVVLLSKFYYSKKY